MKKRDENTCEICGREYEAYCSYYDHHDWIDGRRHAVICHICFDVPQVYVEEHGILHLAPFDPNRLRTVKDMVEDGWDKKDAEIAVKAVKAAIKKGKSRSK